MGGEFDKWLTFAQTEAIPAEATADTQVPEVDNGATLEDEEIQQREHKTRPFMRHLVLTVFSIYIEI